jgi:DNA-binding MarR family transcriptional regulator
MATASTSAAARLSSTELAAWRGFRRAHALLMRELDCELEEAHGLPLVSYDVLVALEEAPDHRMRMRELADAVLLSRSGLTRLVDRLVGEGLIKRSTCSADARGAYAVLTPKGKRTLQTARPQHLDAVRRRFLAHFEHDELVQLTGAWERLNTESDPPTGYA